MTTRLLQIILKCFIVIYFTATVAVMVFAVHMTHLHGSVTLTFGDIETPKVALAETINLAQLEPLPIFPQHKPRVPK